MEDNAARSLQMYKIRVGLIDWHTFVVAVEHKFGAIDYRNAIQDLLNLKQEGAIEDYINDFEALQF
jgi:hypothetical protein